DLPPTVPERLGYHHGRRIAAAWWQPVGNEVALTNGVMHALHLMMLDAPLGCSCWRPHFPQCRPGWRRHVGEVGAEALCGREPDGKNVGELRLLVHLRFTIVLQRTPMRSMAPGCTSRWLG